MSKFFSKTTLGFYDSDIHGTSIPKDAVAVTDEAYFALLDSQSAGKVITADKTGNPLIADPAPLSGNGLILQQITALESTQTPRRIREAVKDPTWMNALDTQIATLRSQLSK